MKKLFFAVIFFLSLIAPEASRAASLEIVKERENIWSLGFKSQEGPVNILSGEISVGDLKSSEIKTLNGGSVVGAWIEEPLYKDGKVIFSGLVPGGASEGKILNFAVFPSSDKNVQFKASGTGYLNDGAGTLLNFSPLVLDVKFFGQSQTQNTQTEIRLFAADKTSPENFTINIGRDRQIFNNQWFATFSAQDGQSGIAYYEVWEGKVQDLDKAKWEKAKSPYILKDQSRKMPLFIRAYDQAGNFKEEFVAGYGSGINFLLKWPFYAIILLIIAAVGGLVWKQNVKKN